MTILVIDDDPLMLRMLARPLADCHGIMVRDVWTARTPEEAMSLVEKAPPGPLAVISDFNLRAGLNGLQVLRAVRERRPEALRILMSGYSREQIGDVSGGGAAEAFVEKALRFDEILHPLCHLLEERFAASST